MRALQFGEHFGDAGKGCHIGGREGSFEGLPIGHGVGHFFGVDEPAAENVDGSRAKSRHEFGTVNVATQLPINGRAESAHHGGHRVDERSVKVKNYGFDGTKHAVFLKGIFASVEKLATDKKDLATGFDFHFYERDVTQGIARAPQHAHVDIVRAGFEGDAKHVEGGG